MVLRPFAARQEAIAPHERKSGSTRFDLINRLRFDGDKSVETALVEGSPQWLTDLTTHF